MKSPPVKVKLTGSVRPPADMVEAAKRSLGDRYDDFVTKFPGEITPEKLVRHVEAPDGSRT